MAAAHTTGQDPCCSCSSLLRPATARPGGYLYSGSTHQQELSVAKDVVIASSPLFGFIHKEGHACDYQEDAEVLGQRILLPQQSHS